MMHCSSWLVAAIIGCMFSQGFSAVTLDVKNFGAIADGSTLNTKAIQKAIDSCNKAGGGTVLLQGGSYMSGTLYIKSNVTVQVDAGATLLGSGDFNQYTTDTYKNMYNGESYMDRCFIFSQNASNVGLVGKGTVNGSGKSFAALSRPMMIRFLSCTTVVVKNLHLLNPGAYTSVFLYCKNVTLDSLNISARAQPNGDGTDFDGCDGVTETNCEFDCSDDAICLQASKKSNPCKNVHISKCHTTVARGGALRIGLLSVGDFDSVEVDNCQFDGLKDCGFKIQECEGGTMSNFNFHDIELLNSPRVCFMTLNSFRFSCLEVDAGRALPAIDPNSYSNIKYTNIKLTNAAGSDVNSYSTIAGIPGHTIDNVTFSGITFNAPGGGSSAQAAKRNLGEITDKRPEPSVLGVTPGYGLYMHHAKNITVQNSVYKTLSTDARKAIVGEDATNVTIINTTMQGGIDCPGYKTVATSVVRQASARYTLTGGTGTYNVYSTNGALIRSLSAASAMGLPGEMRRAGIPAGTYLVSMTKDNMKSLQIFTLTK